MLAKHAHVKSFVVIIIFGLILLSACQTTPKLAPVNSASLPIYPGAYEMTAARAAEIGAFFSPWSIKGGTVQSGPYKGYDIEAIGNTISGIRFYSLQGNPGDDIRSFFDSELSKNGWTKGKDITGEKIIGYSWVRGDQIFAVAYPVGAPVMVTLLLNK